MASASGAAFIDARFSLSGEPAVERPTTTRFAPAPTGRLHLGHLANAICVWGMARQLGARVLLRMEDHDRQRCRPEYEAALLDVLDQLGLAADEPSTDELRAGPSTYRQSDNGPIYAAALEQLADVTDVYGCDCSRGTFADWARANRRPWAGTGCPGGCLTRGLDRRRADLGVRAALGDGDERWDDLLGGRQAGLVALGGDPLVRDRNGNWTYLLCVVADDLRHGVDLVVRGEDLRDATPQQIRLGRLLGRPTPPRFAHHGLVRRPDGTKLSKADGATSIQALMEQGRTVEQLVAEARIAAGLGA
jgi:glutamyl-Q tRNA(Asp) synthetase